jgi:uncharacterized protein (TIGR00255 family)
LDTGIKKYLSSRFSRGKVDVNIRIKEENAQLSVSVNEKAAEAYKKAICELSMALKMKEEPSLETILGLEGVLKIETNRDAEKYWAFIEPVLVASADQFELERLREGKDTGKDILSHIAIIEDASKIISSHVPQLEAAIKENLRERFYELLGEKIDENRILSETAIILMKYTISEELSRLSSHLADFRLETEQNPSPGKKLDFLCQEINREINTIGSKTPLSKQGCN